MALDLELILTSSTVLYTLATVALVFVLYRTIKQFQSTVEVSRVQTKYRFRPWIGPINQIKDMGTDSKSGKHQFDLTIKNYGEIPAQNVRIFCKIDNKMMPKEFYKSEGVESFDLGPMLPNMEKHYWIFIDSDMFEKAKEGKEKIVSALYLEYPIADGDSGYGMISEYNKEKNIFVHKEMWVETPNDLTKPSKKS